MIGKIAKSPYFYVILVALVFVVFVTSAAVEAQRNECQSEAERLGLEWRYGAGTATCQVNTPDFGWWNLSDYTKILAIRQVRGER